MNGTNDAPPFIVGLKDFESQKYNATTYSFYIQVTIGGKGL